MDGKKAKKKTYFDIYRYQIIPVDRYWAPELFSKINCNTIDELISYKNDFFSDAISELPISPKLKTNRADLTCKILHSENQEYLFEFAVERSIIIEKPDFKKETVETWPAFKVFIWNTPDHQYAVIQKRVEAFASTWTIVIAIETAINFLLKTSNLKVHFEALFESRRFWDTVKAHPDELKEVRFELITPNMSNISECLTEELKDLAKNTNSSKMTVSLVSDDDSSLKLEDSNQSITGMVDYASNGGGNITFRAKNVRRLIRTNSSIKRVEFDELEMSSSSSKELVNALKSIL